MEGKLNPMTAFQNTREQTEQKVIVHLLSEIERNPTFTQRGLAAELGIALGLMNQYLKRCITKGWIRASQVSAKRLTYFITPEGFIEKSQMVTDYLARSLTFFRDARTQCEAVLLHCRSQNWTKIALLGAGDVADIAKLVFHHTDIQVEVLSLDEQKIGVDDKVVKLSAQDLKDILNKYDAILITDIEKPQKTFDTIQDKVEQHRILTLKLLHISRHTIHEQVCS